MSIWDKIKKNEFEDEEELAGEEAIADPAPVKSAPSAGHTKTSAGSANALELKVVRPETFESAPAIADHLINRCTVVLNLEATNKETAKRLIDFLSGVAYSIDGSVRRVATNTFVITPSNVGISGEALSDAPKSPLKKAADEDIFG
ncbi:MAG: cell division protein SepF [Clostridia bacterium]|nr:cell division protein SepF [Clostridia bacterium]MBQ8235635.1 cell division protein SepF [Clostridia bacterium]MBQ8399849.1 cell division protein SepF [Clostridia bacterium]